MDSYGILSLLPPLLAVIIAIRTKNVITALFWSGLLGVFVLAGGNPITAVPMYIKDYIFFRDFGKRNILYCESFASKNTRLL